MLLLNLMLTCEIDINTFAYFSYARSKGVHSYQQVLQNKAMTLNLGAQMSRSEAVLARTRCHILVRYFMYSLRLTYVTLFEGS